jgi:RND family efflux transporter MFP subunit
MYLSFVFSFALVLLFAGCSSRPDSDDKPKPGAESKTEPANLGGVRLTPEQIKINQIQVAEVTEASVTPTVSAVGHVRARAGGEAEVYSPFAGRLLSDKPLPQPGDAVSTGQIIAEVEQQFVAGEKLQIVSTSLQLQAEIQQAQHELELKNAEQVRAQQLYEGGAIPLKQLQSARFDVQQAETKLDAVRSAKQEYDAVQSPTNAAPRRVAILAPISGTVLAVDATVGQQVEPARKILTVADLSTIWVEAAVHERDFPQARNARHAEIAMPDATGKSFNGSLVTIGNVVDPQNRTIPMIFEVANPKSTLKLEMVVNVQIPLASAPAKALVIPQSALLSGNGSSSVYVEVQPGIYRPRTVEASRRMGDMVVVLSGLSIGEKVVAVGAQSLRGESRKAEIPVDEDDKDKEKDKKEK